MGIKKFNEKFNETKENNPNYSLSDSELEMIEKGKKHWELDILKREKGGYLGSETIKDLINKVIENTWVQAKDFYKDSEV